ncbi:helix-turn-helix transcriptional regulator [Caldimonas brevitalea]|uniref:Transcriptional regulator, AraC family n=1 Tax=Caldimonas brevitalea TaxID=413882 RepID=A0A0G3BGD1_9BURK|nr:AraC family transcriptional regulator [Caldimonas brevitalea]AKJ27028.1 transcriptional regulator, AraC family [Caldimonas brevitalea]
MNVELSLPPGATALVASRVHHRVATVAIREHMLGWVQAGSKTLLGPTGEHRYVAGEVFLVAQGTQWDVINDPAPQGRYVAQILLFGPALVQAFHARHPALQTTPQVRGRAALPADGELCGAIQRSVESLQSPTTSSALQEHRLIEVLLLLAERGFSFAPETVSWQDKVRRLIAYRPHADWTLEAVAQEFHLSVSTLSRRLAQHGTTLGSLVREVRLETALVLLQTTELPVGEIAQRCGYESHSRFSAVFRRRFGFAPSHLRPAEGAQGLTRREQETPVPG